MARWFALALAAALLGCAEDQDQGGGKSKLPAAWPFCGSEDKQARMIPRFFELTHSLDLRYATWAFLHDPPSGSLNPAFTDIGLRSNGGRKSPRADSRPPVAKQRSRRIPVSDERTLRCRR